MSQYHENVRKVLDGVDAFFKRNFTEIVIDGPRLNAEEIQKEPVMLVSSHRSHLDYFFVGEKFSRFGIKNLRFAAGSNLTNLPYVGKKFTNFGAFAVERDTGFERNYVRNLCNRVVEMMEKGEAIIVFPEGGRSYSGSMLELRSGILAASILLRAKNPGMDVQLIPIAVTYDCPPDLPWFPLLLKGKKMRKRENFFLTKILGSIYYFGADLITFVPLISKLFPKKKIGKIYLDYDLPVPVSQLADIEKNRAAQARDEFSAHRQSMQLVSNAMYERIYKLVRVLPQHLVAHLVKKTPGCTEASLLEKIESVLQKVKQESRNCKTIGSMSREQIVRDGIKFLISIKALHSNNGVLSIRSQSMIDYFAATL